MGYIINYSNSDQLTKRTITTEHKGGNSRSLFLLAMILICALVFTAKASGFDFYQLLPGNKDITKAALAAFLHNISDGICFKDAIAAFCAEILDGALLG